MSKQNDEIKKLKSALRAWNVWARGTLGVDDQVELREAPLREALTNAYAAAAKFQARREDFEERLRKLEMLNLHHRMLDHCDRIVALEKRPSMRAYEKPCPECLGKGFLSTDMKPYDAHPDSDPSYMDDFQRCWNNCVSGYFLTDAGKEFVEFFKRHLSE